VFSTMSRLRIMLLLSLIALTLLRCDLFTQAVNSGVDSAVNQTTGQRPVASRLWPDVPPLPGASAGNIGLPPAVNLLVQQALRVASSS